VRLWGGASVINALFSDQFRQLGDVGGDAARLVSRNRDDPAASLAAIFIDVSPRPSLALSGASPMRVIVHDEEGSVALDYDTR
jgi:hypothetical protein